MPEVLSSQRQEIYRGRAGSFTEAGPDVLIVVTLPSSLDTSKFRGNDKSGFEFFEIFQGVSDFEFS